VTRLAIRCLACRVTFLDLTTYTGHPCAVTRAERDGHPSTLAAPVPPTVEQRAEGPGTPSSALGIVSTSEGGQAS
jgi:hypothetical protein